MIMKWKIALYIVIIAFVAGIVILIDPTKPKPVDWSPTYSVKDKRPLGLHVFAKEAPNLFRGDSIKKLDRSAHEYFNALYDYDNSRYRGKGTFLCISNVSTLDPDSVRELLYFADYGNTIFLSMQDFPKELLDTLKVKVKGLDFLKDPVHLSLNEKLDGKQYHFKEGISLTYFDAIDTLTTKILGYQEVKNKQKGANFISARFGNGTILLHTQPAAFSNFHLLESDHYEYAQAVVSYIPQGNVYWQTLHFTSDKDSGGLLRYIMKQPALRVAFWLSILTLIIFIFFNAKRKQRIIPQIAPLKNTTVDFAKTIGNLYYQESNHHTIVEKKIIYFLEHIRNEYYIDTYSLDDAFVEKLHLKTGKPVEDIQKAVDLIKKHRHDFLTTEDEVIAINKAIENLRI